MDKLEEVKKLKKLLDDGIIDEEDFTRKKAELLGMTKPEAKEEDFRKEATKIKSLDDYEKELINQSENQEEINNKSDANPNDEYYLKEKLKAKAKLDAEEEIRDKRKAEKKAAVNKGVNQTKRVLMWILAVVLWILGITSMCMTSQGIVYLFIGIIFFLQGCMACPKITDYTQSNSKFEVYKKYKTLFVWITIILWFILIYAFATPS
jgi:hypothetical protein